MKVNTRRAHLDLDTHDRRVFARLFVDLPRNADEASNRRDLAAQLRSLADTIEEDAE